LKDGDFFGEVDTEAGVGDAFEVAFLEEFEDAVCSCGVFFGGLGVGGFGGFFCFGAAPCVCRLLRGGV
jgi:hypothetical protein